ncbi:MAG: M28 family peptidase [Gemmatimonadetes bacterium]|nr:M28 family peptidase [Gemmatimonadota bacterium]
MRFLVPATALVLSVAAGSALASPLSPAQLDAQVTQCLAEVNADSLFSYIGALQGFGTRHTVSDTTSTTFGIGAARRWVHDKFLEFQSQGGNLVVSYEDFTLTISGVNRLHRNVVAEIPGTAAGTAEERIYVIGGHLDSRNEDVDDPLGTAFGADDDASGVSCAIELARVMSTKSWPMTLRFVAFVGEEQGLIGSDWHAARAVDRGDPIAAMLNNDTMASIIGAPHPDSTAMTDTTLARVFASPPEEGPHRQFQRHLKSLGDAYVPIQQVVMIPAVDRPTRGGDHESFVSKGFTAIRYMEYLEEVDRQHTTDGDTLGAHLDRNYIRRNAQVDLATLGSLALSPASPTGLAVADIGDSSGFRLTWPSTNTEPDLSGYLVTIRTPGALDYDQVIDVGLVNEYVYASAAAESLYFGLSVRNTGDHRALVAREVLGVLSTLPGAPDGLVAAPDGDSVALTWNPRAEADLAGYRVWRSTTSGGGYAEISGGLVTSTTFDDVTAPAHTRLYYVVTAEDVAANASPFSEEAGARLVTLDSGVLFVDETKPGQSAWFPNDALADSVYAEMLAGIPHDVLDWDADGPFTLSDLGIYSTVIWASDDFNGQFQGYPLVTQYVKDAQDALRAYLDAGGNVLLAAWEGAAGIDYPDDQYPRALGPGDFLYDYFGVETAEQKREAAFEGGHGAGAFADVFLEPTRLRPQWNGTLIRAEYFSALRPEATVPFTFRSSDPDSAYDFAPCASAVIGTPWRSMYLGFPLYHLATADAQALLGTAVTFLENEGTDAPVIGGARGFALGVVRPNPFRGETEIRWSVPTDRARVRLDVYDVAGRRVRALLDDRLAAGPHAMSWDGRNDDGHRVAAGVYFLRMRGEDAGMETRFSRKIVRLQ